MAETLHQHDITAVILAGGQGQRMGGQDKGLLTLWGKSLIAHVLHTVDGQAGDIVISANRNLDRYREFGRPVYEDILGQRWGPLAGLVTAMRYACTPYVLTVPCDCPCLPADLVERMVNALILANGELCVAHDGERLQNTVALLPCELADDLEAYLNSGQRKAEIWLRQHNLVEAGFSDQTASFQNINTLEQLQRLEQQQSCDRALIDQEIDQQKIQ